MSNDFFDTEQLNSIMEMRGQGFIKDAELRKLIEYFELGRNNALSKDDFLNIKYYYMLKYKRVLSFNNFEKIKELYEEKIKGESDIPIQGRIDAYEQKSLIKLCSSKQDHSQKLLKFYFSKKAGLLSNDDFLNLIELYIMKDSLNIEAAQSPEYIKRKEFYSILKFYTQKINGLLIDDIIEGDETIPEYTMTRLYKIKLLGRINNDVFEKMKKLFLQYDSSQNELKKEELHVLLFLLENSPKD